LFDEPLSNLDATLRGQTRIEIARLHKQFEHASVVYVTHDQVEAMTLADKIVLLRAGPDVARLGSIAQIGTPLELYHRPANRFVAGFIGSPQMNFLPATVSAADRAGVRIVLDQTGEELQLALDGSALVPGTPVTLGVRPEHLSCHPDALQAIRRRVMLVERLGEQTYLHLEQAGGAVLMAKVQGNASVDIGDEVTLGIAPEAGHLFTADGNAVAALIPIFTPVHPLQEKIVCV